MIGALIDERDYFAVKSEFSSVKFKNRVKILPIHFLNLFRMVNLTTRTNMNIIC